MRWQKLRFFFRKITTQDIDSAIASVDQNSDWNHVLWLCDRYLSRNPESVPVVLTRARCYQAMNRPQAFKGQVSLAVALDDTFVPALYQQAGIYIEEKRIAEALSLIELIKDHPATRDGVDAMLSDLCMRRAQAGLAREYQLRAWMTNFDNLRHANAYLFRLTYADVDELDVAREHQFWAQTQPPCLDIQENRKNEILVHLGKKLGKDSIPLKFATANKHRIRIGYWGGDFKEHSVRYFFRPLIESHNQEKFETFIYDDNFMNGGGDQQTEAIKNYANHFFDTANLSDEEIVVLIESHQLDILVDLQGHTSANRLHLWQLRLAPLQITGLAYPPTTGLSTIDYKMVDVHMVSKGSAAYYTERQMIMPNSFWCFDPKEEAPFVKAPPYIKNGYITLGCLGNAAKITPAIMLAWSQILKEVSSVRLLVVSHSFGESVTEDAFRARLQDFNIPLNIVECKASIPRDQLWQLYQEIDMVLDTFPFNGGTTSCWATYAGVPVLTLSGESLTSCMGKSIMSNLGFPEFIAGSIDEYVDKGISIINNPKVIDNFRANARGRFKASSLGNGNYFAAEFEDTCLNLLEQRRNGCDPAGPAPTVPALPLAEMLRRVRMVWYHGNVDACERILKVCRQHYGADPTIVEYEAEIMLGRRQFAALDRVCADIEPGYPELWHLQAQAALARGEDKTAYDHILRIVDSISRNEDNANSVASLQNRKLQGLLWQAWLTVANDHAVPRVSRINQIEECSGDVAATKVLVVLVGNDLNHHCNRIKELESLFKNPICEIIYKSCSIFDRINFINECLASVEQLPDVIILLRDHVEISHDNFLSEILWSLTFSDIVSSGGAFRWIQKDWTQDLPKYKAWGLMRPSHLSENLYELYFAGTDTRRTLTGACVLDGQLLAFVPSRVIDHKLDEEMGGSGYWAEEDWCNRIHLAGGRLTIHRALGVVLHASTEIGNLHTTHGQVNLLRRLKIDPMQIPVNDYSIQSVQIHSPLHGIQVADIYLD